MKLFNILIALFLIGCSSPETPKTETANCNCERSYYIYQPPMNGPNGQVLIPGVYKFVSMQTQVCGTTTNGYVAEQGVNYSHQQTVCK